jgi:hypothetical protein
MKMQTFLYQRNCCKINSLQLSVFKARNCIFTYILNYSQCTYQTKLKAWGLKEPVLRTSPCLRSRRTIILINRRKFCCLFNIPVQQDNRLWRKQSFIWATRKLWLNYIRMNRNYKYSETLNVKPQVLNTHWILLEMKHTKLRTNRRILCYTLMLCTLCIEHILYIGVKMKHENRCEFIHSWKEFIITAFTYLLK